MDGCLRQHSTRGAIMRDHLQCSRSSDWQLERVHYSSRQMTQYNETTTRFDMGIPDLLKELHTEDVKQGQNNIEKINNKVNEEQRTSCNKEMTPGERRRNSVTSFGSMTSMQAEKKTAGVAHIPSKKSRRLQKIGRVACCLGWLFLCPCWTLGVCIREHPETEQDCEEDPCWPCFVAPEPDLPKDS